MIKSLFMKPSARELAQRELDEAQRELLAAQSAQEYAAALVRYHQVRIERLTKALNDVAVRS